MRDFIPRPYQAEAIDRIIGTPGFGLFVEPGGGKTVTVATAADIVMNQHLAADRMLIVAPKMVAQEVWWRECAKWRHLAHLQPKLITAADMGYKRITQTRTRKGQQFEETVTRPADRKAVRRALLDSPEQIHVVSRDHLYWLAETMGKDWPYRLVAGDESTSFKDHMSNRSRALRFLRRHELIERIVLMSGTPSPKGLEQLWAQILILDNGIRLGETLSIFRDRFMRPDKRNKDRIFTWKPKAGATQEVMDLISDICMSVRASEWRENEEPSVVQRRVTIPRGEYDTMEASQVLQIGRSEAIAVNAGVLHGKLCQIASGAVLDESRAWHEIHTAKLDDLEALVEELDGEPLLVLYWYQSSFERLKKRFPKIATIKTPGFLDKFAAGQIPILAINPASAGHGLDGLQHGGHHVAVFDITSDYELYKQAVDRIDRSGQQHQVTVHLIVAEDTVDESVAGVLASRAADQGRVMDAIAYRFEKVYQQARSGQ